MNIRDIDKTITTEDINRLIDYHTENIRYWKTQDGPGVDGILETELNLKRQYTEELKRRDNGSK